MAGTGVPLGAPVAAASVDKPEFGGVVVVSVRAERRGGVDAGCAAFDLFVGFVFDGSVELLAVV
jgi:hypothetical protein